MQKKFNKILVANRGEIAIRIFRACAELGIKSVGIYSKEDKYSLFRTKADESYLIGVDKGPIDVYLDMDGIIALAKEKNVDAIHPGYGFLAENSEFVRKCEENGIAFIGPSADIMDKMGDKINSKKVAHAADVPTIPGVDKVIETVEEAKKVADAIKADGWKFASHTWGHIRIGDASLESIQKDTEKWLSYVAPLVGGTDTIIFAHGQDLADWHDYSADNEKFTYLKSKGFNFFCNVDSSQYFLQIRDNYVRQGRRNLDGYRLWNDVHGEKNRTSDLFDATQILDPARTDMPPL